MQPSRNHLFASLLLPLLACSGSGSGSGTEPFTVAAVDLHPVAPVVVSGGAATFTATVRGTGPVPQGVSWSVEPGDASRGTIDASGRFHAPAVGAPVTATVRATSIAAPGVSGSATVEMRPAGVYLSPGSAAVFTGATSKFTALALGVPGPVRWGCGAGTVSDDGLYTAPATPSAPLTTVWAEAADGSARGQAEVTFALRPPVVTGTSGAADVGQTLVISGADLSDAGPTNVLFSSGGGAPIRIPAVVAQGTLTVVVPPGAQAGSLLVEKTAPGLAPATSAPVAFERPAFLRVHLERSEAAAGESVAVDVVVFGDPSAGPVALETDLGSIEGGRWRAPATVDAPGFATVRACLAGTTTCAGATLRVLPFRIEPEIAVVQAGGVLQLSAVDGAGAAPAAFSLLVGDGQLDGSGRFDAPLAGAGPRRAWVAAERGGLTLSRQVAVAGAGPGLLSQLQEPVDDRPGGALGQPWAVSANTTAVAGGRLYVPARRHRNGGIEGLDWVDVYDLADPVRPRWIGAFEPAVPMPRLRVARGRLYAVRGTSGPPSIAVYDLAGPMPALAAFQSFPDRRPGALPDASFPVFEGDTLYTFAPLTAASASVTIRIHDVAAGPLPEPRLVEVPIPSDARLSAGFFAWTVRGGQAFLASNGHQRNRLQAYDLSASPAQLLWERDRPTLVLPELAGRFLLLEGCFLDREAGLAPAGCLALAVEGQLQVVEVAGDRAYLSDGMRIQAVDLAAPGGPRTIATMPGQMGALLDGRWYQPMGAAGIGVVDVAQPGGPVARGRVNLTDERTELNSTRLRGGLAYAGGHDFATGLLAAWDLSTSPPARVFREDRPEALLDLAIEGDLLLAASALSLDAYSLADPAAPARLGRLPIDAFCVGVAGGLAWVGTLAGELVAVDLSDPAALRSRGRLPLPAGLMARTVAPLAPGLLVLGLTSADGSTGDVVVVDASLPDQPRLLGSAGLGLDAIELAVDGTTAAVVTFAGLVTIDLSTPSLPTPLALVTPPFEYWPDYPAHPVSIGLAHGYAWVGYRFAWANLIGYDLRDPTWPREVARYSMTGADLLYYPGRVVTEGDRALVTLTAVIAGGRFDWLVDLDLSNPRNEALSWSGATSPGP